MPGELTTRQAARELGVSARTVRRYLAVSKLEGRKVVREDGLQEWRIDADALRRVAADLKRARPRGQMRPDTVADEVRLLRETVEALQQQIERLSLQVAEYQRALPPPPAPEQTSDRPRRWWAFWRS